MPGKRSGRLRWLIILGVIGGLIYIFYFEINFLIDLGRTLIQGSPVAGFPDINQAIRVILFFLMNAVFGSVILVWSFHWMASALFPLQNNHQVNQFVKSFLKSIIKNPGSIIFVRKGKLSDTNDRNGGEGILVDLESAVVLESQRFHKQQKNNPDPVQSISATGSVKTKVLGTGFHYLERSARIRDAVSLRNQIRTQSNVLCQTIDGIEMSANAEVIFTLGMEPDICHVFYDGEQTAENILILEIDPITRKIQAIKDELDEQDKQEVHDTAQRFLFMIEPSSPLVFHPENHQPPPYLVNEARITAAAYSRARNVNDRQLASRWSDLPAMVAAEVLRSLIARYTLDGLFLPEDPLYSPWQSELNPEFFRRLRNSGVLAFQFCYRLDGSLPDLGQRVDHRTYRISTVNNLKGSKTMRDRGIKVVDASIKEMTPTDPNVHQQRLHHWRTRWQQEADEVLTGRDQELTSIKNSSRKKSLLELVSRFSVRIENSEVSEQELSDQLIQELDEIAINLIDKKEGGALMSRLLVVRSWLCPNKQDELPSVTDGKIGFGEDE